MRSNGCLSSAAVRVGGLSNLTSPATLFTNRPPLSLAARPGRTRNVTFRPAASNRAPKYPPIAPAPIIRILTNQLLTFERLLVNTLSNCGCAHPVIGMEHRERAGFHQAPSQRRRGSLMALSVNRGNSDPPHRAGGREPHRRPRQNPSSY